MVSKGTTTVLQELWTASTRCVWNWTAFVTSCGASELPSDLVLSDLSNGWMVAQHTHIYTLKLSNNKLWKEVFTKAKWMTKNVQDNLPFRYSRSFWSQLDASLPVFPHVSLADLLTTENVEADIFLESCLWHHSLSIHSSSYGRRNREG